MSNQNGHTIDERRRKALKTVGIGVGTLTGFTVGSSVTSASPTNESTTTAESSDKQGTWTSTDRSTWTAEQRAAARNFEKEMDVTVTRVRTPTETQVEPKQLPRTQFSRSVTGHDAVGVPIYTFHHLITWKYDGSNVYNYTSNPSGEVHDILWSYDGVGETDIREGDNRTTVMAKREGIFSGPFDELRPYIHIGGDAGGFGFLIEEDDGT